jgi:16S rRNA (cytidine1402-2'-O)-methyltransferase
MSKTQGILYLIPVDLGGSLEKSIPQGVLEIAISLNEFIVENERTARRFLVSAGYQKSIDEIKFHVLNKYTHTNDIPSFLKALREGKDIGLLSEAGCPCIADPGQIVVHIAQKEGFVVKPLIGPNSMILALMASGFNGQCFAFNGYLPIDKNNRENSIREMEKNAMKNGCSQIFMETPFRNNNLLENLLQVCKPTTLLCIALDITTESEQVKTKTIAEWKKNRPDINKRQAVFIIGN